MELGASRSGGPLPLDGRKILLVEDEYLIAEDVAAMLREAGGQVIGPAASLPMGVRLAEQSELIDAAVLNIDLQGVEVYPLADELLVRGVPFLFLTGYGDDQIPEKYAGIRCCNKPVSAASVINEVRGLLRLVAT